MRKLASIQTVNAVEPIPNADAIERVRVLGWWVVAKKGEHAVGDRIVYCEIDSLLPELPSFEFLRRGCYRAAIEQGGQVVQRAGFRIKTVRLRGQVSQGICFPLGILPLGTPTDDGTDVTDLLGIIKHDPPPPANMAGRVKGTFPSFIPKTDETRVQVLEAVIARHRGRVFNVTEKLDGSSFTAFLRDGSFGVCSRNLLLDESDESHLFVQLVKRLELGATLVRLRDKYRFDPAVQGEVVGPGIQGNKYGLRAVELRVFNLFDITAGRLVDADRSLELLREFRLEAVPQLGSFTLDHDVDGLIRMAEGVSVLNPKVQREGIVLRPNAEEHDTDLGGRLSFKAINPLFLLKYDE
jgi:RNA ligase (TIGR02306 family)